MDWVWTVGVAWLLLGVGLALLIGRSIVLADRRAAHRDAELPNFVVDRPPLMLVPEHHPTDLVATPDSPGSGSAIRPPIPLRRSVGHRPSRRAGSG
jgi:hypothetical protein